MAGEGLCIGGRPGHMEQDPVSFPPPNMESVSGFLLNLLYCDLQFSLICYGFYACTCGSVFIFQMHTVSGGLGPGPGTQCGCLGLGPGTQCTAGGGGRQC